MPVSPADIDRVARRLIHRYGAGARSEAASWIEVMWSLDDPANAILWTQVSAAVSRLLEAELRQPVKAPSGTFARA